MVLIAGFKVVKGLLLLLVGLGFLRLVHAETATLFSKLLEALHLNAESHILHALVLQVDALRPESILTLGAMSMLYAGLLLTEGLGLWCGLPDQTIEASYLAEGQLKTPWTTR